MNKVLFKGITWVHASRIMGAVIIFSLLVAYLYAEARGKHLETPIALALLGIGGALIGAPRGWMVVKRNGINGDKKQNQQ